MFFAYVLQNPKGILYKGSTDNLDKRFKQHNNNDGFISFTIKRGPWELVYSEQFETRKEAEAREKFFKTGHGRQFVKNEIKKLNVNDMAG
jgi:putative endonuclease